MCRLFRLDRLSITNLLWCFPVSRFPVRVFNSLWELLPTDFFCLLHQHTAGSTSELNLTKFSYEYPVVKLHFAGWSLANTFCSGNIWWSKRHKITICNKNGVYGFYFASCMNIIFNELRGCASNTIRREWVGLYWVMTQAFWLATLKTDGPITGNITILLGHAIFASSEYCYDGYRRIARSISSKSIYALNLACKLLLWLFSYLLCRATLHLSLVVWQDVLHLFLVKTWQVLYLIVFLHIHNHKSVTIMKNPRNIT